MPYAAPIAEMQFVLRHIAGIDSIAALPGHDSVTSDLVDAVLDQAGKLAGEVLAPLNWVGDQEGSVLENGVVRTPKGFKEAYKEYVAGGWNAVPFEAEYGGQELPWTLGSMVQEMWQGSNMSFGLCPLLNQGCVEALLAHASEEQKRTYLPKLIEGVWTGTMNLTEPQAGSDLAAVRTKAWRDGDAYKIQGQKIYITYGEHDFTENIIHLVLARLPDAPPGVKGISLFIVPKFLLNADGTPGPRNDLRCVSLEHKLGIHASPTAVMSYGDNGGAVGYLVGQENQGLSYMFTMMNNARLSVGLQGVAIAERAYQHALDYAKARVQGRALTGGANNVTIIHHPDVRRMLLTMRAYTQAARGITAQAFAALDTAKCHEDAETRAIAQRRVDFLTPIVKAFGTDIGNEVAYIGVQIHGGMGFIEETGAAQYLRDARILPIYEGTNGIQANDLVFRKLLRDNGQAAGEFIAAVKEARAEVAAAPGDDAAVIARAIDAALPVFEQATGWLLDHAKDPNHPAAGAVPYTRMAGLVAGAAVMALSAAAALEGLRTRAGDPAFLNAKLITARFYAESLLPAVHGLLGPATAGGATLMALPESDF
jgi:alkylation response protein AidB-like acyl-CoA dehydrogenase